MSKTDFINALNKAHKRNDREYALIMLINSTQLGDRVCKEILRHNWDASKTGAFGTNIYHFLEVCLNEDSAVEYKPITKKGAEYYINYLDNHAAAYALHKIKQYKYEKPC